MKKLVLIAACAVTVLLAACGSSEENKNQTTEPTVTQAADATKAPTSTPVPEKAEEYERGVLTEAGFESKWLDLRFTTQDNMYMLSQEEADAANQGEEDTVMEMMVQMDGGSNIMLQVQQLPKLASSMTEKEYLTSVMDDMKAAVGDMPLTVVEEFYNVEIGGADYLATKLAIEYGAGAVVNQEFIVRKKDDRMIAMVISYATQNETDGADFIKCFGSYDSAPVYLEKAQKEEAASDGVFNAGTWDGSVYANEWLGFKFTAPEGVECTNTEMANAVMVQAYWPEGLPIVQITAEKSGYEGITEEDYIDALVTTLEAMAGTVNYTFDENLYSVELGGQEYINLATVAETEGVQMYQDYCVREQDGYFVVIILTYIDGQDAALQQAVDAFTAY